VPGGRKRAAEVLGEAALRPSILRMFGVCNAALRTES
jgi:hypothetical protein